jgi:alditol oxidase
VTVTNWAGNVVFTPAALLRPGSADELRAVIAGQRKARVLGTGHSFSRVADSPGALITLDGLPREIDIDTAHATVRAGAAVRYAELAAKLAKSGFALANLASLPHITVAGATATGTHGSGSRNGSLATAVEGIDLVTADGDLVTVPEDDLSAAAVGLGAFGVVTALTLRLVPAFTARQWVYDNLPRKALEANFAEIFDSAYSVSAFTTWRDPAVLDMLWLKHRADDGWSAPDTWHGARRADGPRHPVPGMPVEYTTKQDGVEGPWHERLPHFRAEFTPSAGDELQSEYLLPREHAVAALEALAGLAPRIAPLLLINEIRTVAADDLWLSPAYGRDTVAFHFTWRKDPAAVTALLPAIEERLAPFQPRPHWGKVFTLAAEEVRAVYPRLRDFAGLAREYDPAGTFRNDFLDGILEG